MPASQPANFNLQEFTDAGQLLVGGRLYTFAYGTTAQKTAFTDPDGTVPHTYTADGAGGQYIALNARGELPAPLYLAAGSYDIMLKRADGSVVWTRKADGVDNSVRSWMAAVAAAAGSTLVGFIQNVAGAVQQTVADVLSDLLSVKSFGLKNDGVTGNSNAMATMWANLGVSTYEVLVPKGDYLLDASVAIPSNIKLRFRAGARFVIPDGVTLTLNNPELLAGRQHIFKCTGTGKVVGTIRNDLIYPEWWGAIADGLHQPVGADFSARAAAAARNAPALQAAADFAGDQYPVNGLTGTVSLTYGFYCSDKPWKIPLSVNVLGYGIGSAIFYYAPTGNAVESINTNNSMLKDFFIAPIAGPTWNVSTGYGLYMDGVSTPIVDNVWSSGFAGGTFFFKNVIEGRLRGLISDNSNGPSFVIRGVGQGTVLENCVTAGTDNGACFDIQSGYDWHLVGCTAKDGPAGTNGFYLNAVENINLTNCGCHAINKEGFLLSSTVLNCTFTNCFVNDASMLAAGVYDAIAISGKRNKFIAPKVTANAPTYRYGISKGGACEDCSVIAENITPGTLGQILDAQPTGPSNFHVRKVSTADATPTTVWSKSLNNNAGCIIEATIVAKQRGATGETASWKVWAYARTGTAGTTLSAPTFLFSYKSNVASTIAATLVLTNASANAGVVSLQITGLGGAVATIDWEATINAISVTG